MQEIVIVISNGHAQPLT